MSTCKNEKICGLAERLYADENFPKRMLSDNLKHINEENFDIAEKITTDKDFPKEYDGKILNQFRIRRKYVRKRWIIKN